MILEGKTLIVTGVGPGLGSEIVRCALRDGANVMLAARTEAKLKAMAERLDPDGRRVAYQATDITDESQCAALTAATLDRFGAIDALAADSGVAVTRIGRTRSAGSAAAPVRARDDEGNWLEVKRGGYRHFEEDAG